MACLKDLGLTAALLSFSVSAYASTGIKEFIPELKNPARTAELRALVASDGEAAKSLLNDVALSGKDSETRCAAISALGASSGEAVAKGLAGLINDPDPAVQACAVRAAGETRNEFAAEALLAGVKEYSAANLKRGPYENNLRARLKVLDAIWSLGEIGNPKVMEKLLKLYGEADDVVKINMVIGAGKTKSESASRFLYKIAGMTMESGVVRAAAYEMLEANKAPAPAAQPSLAEGMERGDLIFTGGIFGVPQPIVGDLPIGHAGLFGGTETSGGKVVVVIYDCVPDSFKPYGGVRKIFSFTNFTHQNNYAFYGNRVSRLRPTAYQREQIIKAAIAKVGHHYSDSHFAQKGPEDFDCVGYTEYAYESAGLNPTPNKEETGWGWPLTPAEQFAATTANPRAAAAAVQPLIPPAGTAPSPALVTRGAAALTTAFGMTGLPLPQVNTSIQPAFN